MNNDAKPICNPYVMLREEFDDWAILFNPDTGHGFGLNPTGVYLWKLLDGEHSMDALLEELREHADNLPKEAGEHIGAFVDALVGEGLAGFDRAAFGIVERPVKFSSSLLEELGATERCTYEPPKLIDLMGGQKAYGDMCSPGSHNTGYCLSGGWAGSGCDVGTSATNNCYPGTLATSGCTATGNSASSMCASCGTNLGGICTSGTGGSGTCY